MNKLISGITKINTSIHKVLLWIVAFFIASMSILVVYQVFCRYVLNSPPGWTEEISLFTMVWLAFLVAPIGYRRNLFVNLDVILARVTPRAFTIITFIYLIIETVILFIFFKYSVSYAIGGLASTATSIPFSMFYIYLCLPIGFALMILVGIEKYLVYINCFATKRYKELADSIIIKR